jgi:Animal haem peroxidase/TAT (twin-arginine translocation) pathway signal sequence
MSENRARDFSRRHFLKGTAAGAVAVSLGTATSAAWMAPAAAEELPPTPPHGAELRGMDLVVKSPTTEGRFGFMFKSQPPHPATDTLLGNLGQTMEEKPVIGKPLTDPLTGQPVMKDGVQVIANKDHNDALGENPNPALTSGFTFVGQFVDHDITFDHTPLSEQQSDPDATTNFRTPRYDLDAIYGRGPNLDTQFYDPADRDKFLLVPTTYDMIRTDTLKTSQVLYDVPRVGANDPDGRTEGKAIIADPRNDQTLIVLQIHVAMQMFHNKLVDVMRQNGIPRSAVFESARRLARWHYQWMVTHEFLPAIVGQTMADSVYKEVSTGAPKITIKYYKPTNPAGRSFIPVEFAVAAYRFGHSMTRPRYTVQDYVTQAGATVAVSSVPLFEAQPNDNNLNGSRPLPPRMKIQWSKFFNKPGDPRTARPVRQFDATMATPLFTLPTTALPDSNPLSLLSSRNLLRGKKMGLPSGQQVARLMGVTPLTNAQLWKNHRIEVKIPIPTSGIGANVVEIIREFDVDNQDLKALFADPGWNGEAPLWFYILKEAEIVGKGRTLGPVGGRIVAEVLVGLLQKDPNSYLYLNPSWKPAAPVTPVRGRFTMADLLTFVGVWS